MSIDTELDQTSSGEIRFRPGTDEDLEATHGLFLDTITDLVWRLGIQDGERIPSEAERVADFRRWRPILEYLTATADQYWVAERGDELLGFARSILRHGVRELTEFFVSPKAQSYGLGRELLSRAMPPGARRTYIMASLDLRAQALYHRLGVYQICAVYTFSKPRERFIAPASAAGEELPTNPTIAMDAPTILPMTLEHLPQITQLDEAIHGHQRDNDHKWLMTHRRGFILFRDNKAVGYGYAGDPYSGPFVMLDPADFPAALAYAEHVAYEQGFADLGVDVPMLNRTAIEFLLNRGYQMSAFFCFYMCDQMPSHVDKTIITAPMIMI
jgi:GNAT superfamily N-acetyltransferase